MSGTSTVMVDAVAVASSGATTPPASFPVGGARHPHSGGSMRAHRCLANASTTASVPQTDATDTVTGMVTVTRRPNIILMTDGEPTQGWSDPFFATAPSSANRNLGNGSAADMGLALLTVLTAAHRKQVVQTHYFPVAGMLALMFLRINLRRRSGSIPSASADRLQPVHLSPRQCSPLIPIIQQLPATPMRFPHRLQRVD